MDKPELIILNAVSIDGRTEGFKIDAKAYFEFVRQIKEDAVIVGAGSLLSLYSDSAYEYIFSEYDFELLDPVKHLIVPDSTGMIKDWETWLGVPFWENIIVLRTENTNKEYLTLLEENHIESVVCGTNNINIYEALKILHHKYHINRIRVDSGGFLNGLLLREGIVSELDIFIHPTVVGGNSPQTIFTELTGRGGAPINMKLYDAVTYKSGLILLKYRLK